MTAAIEVRRSNDAFEATVSEKASHTRRRVTVRDDLLARVAPGVAPEHLIEAAFRFLLDREPKEAILSAFDLAIVSRYFPEFERSLADYLPTSGATPRE